MKIATLAFVCALSFSVSHADEKPTVALAATSYDLSKEEIVNYSKEAAEGSGVAARKLALYYRWEKYNFEKAQYWARIGAENGDAVAQYTLWFKLRVESDYLNQTRALFWLKKSASQGDQTAINELKRCEFELKVKPDKKNSCFGPSAK